MPAEGTTLAHKMINRKTVVSTTVPAEGTTDPATRVYTGIWFQLPCPRRARPGGRFDGRSGDCFNYRARGGHDERRWRTEVIVEFQLPCPRRARHRTTVAPYNFARFQLPCPRRARHIQLRGCARHVCFNYRARGGHDGITVLYGNTNIFFPILREVCDLRICMVLCL